VRAGNRRARQCPWRGAFPEHKAVCRQPLSGWRWPDRVRPGIRFLDPDDPGRPGNGENGQISIGIQTCIRLDASRPSRRSSVLHIPISSFAPPKAQKKDCCVGSSGGKLNSRSASRRNPVTALQVTPLWRNRIVAALSTDHPLAT